VKGIFFAGDCAQQLARGKQASSRT